MQVSYINRNCSVVRVLCAPLWCVYCVKITFLFLVQGKPDLEYRGDRATSALIKFWKQLNSEFVKYCTTDLLVDMGIVRTGLILHGCHRYNDLATRLARFSRSTVLQLYM